MNLYSDFKSSLLFSFVRVCLISWLAFTLWTKLNLLTLALIFTYCGLIILAIPVAIALVSSGLGAVPTQNISTQITKFGVVVTLLLAGALFFLVNSATGLIVTTLSIVDVKFAALIVVIVELIGFIIQKSAAPPAYQLLVDIKRDLQFGHLNTQEASAQIEEALLGLKFAALFKNETRELFEIIERDIQVTETLQGIVAKRACLISETEKYAPNQDQHDTAKLLEAYQTYQSYLIRSGGENLIEDYFKREKFRTSKIAVLLSKINFRATIVMTSKPEVKTESTALTEEIDERLQKLMGPTRQLKESISTLKEASARVEAMIAGVLQSRIKKPQ